MSMSLSRVTAGVLAIVILAFPAVRALPDPAPVLTVEAPAPSDEAPMSTPAAEKPAATSVTESPPTLPEPEASAAPATETLSIYKAEQLEQLLAPIALYPDALLAQILMAATYPLEIVKAARWLQDPAHANLQGDGLAAAIEAEPWDPSIKSLVPLPRILRMMDGELDWTEQLGKVVIAQQADVMDSIQRLRHQAATAGTLWSNAEQRVTTERQGIVIEPANPEFIYPPVYGPAVYGPWPYPDYPPVEISPDPGGGFLLPFGVGFGVGFAVIQPLSRWCGFNWVQRRIQLDTEKFNALNHHRAGIGTDTWRHDLGRQPDTGDFALRTQFQMVRGAISALPMPRVNASSAAALTPTVVAHSAPPSLPTARSLPTAVLRSAPPQFSPGGLQARPGLASPRIMAPSMMPQGSPQLILPETATRSMAWAPGSRAPAGGVSRR